MVVIAESERMDSYLNESAFAIFWRALTKIFSGDLESVSVVGYKTNSEVLSDPTHIANFQTYVILTVGIATFLGFVQKTTRNFLCSWGKQMCKGKTAPKFAKQVYLTWFYGTSVLVGCYCLLDSGFNLPPDRKRFLDMWLKPPAFVHLFHQSLQGGFLLSELFFIFNEPRRSDFVEYVFHHFLASALLVVAVFANDPVFGAFTVLLHDVSDVFLSFAKSIIYVKFLPKIFTDIAFTFFAVSFLVLRLYFFPMMTTMYGASFYLRKFSVPHMIILVFYGIVLQGLHVYWMALIIRMALKLASGKNGDVRSDDEGEEGSTEKKSKKGTKQQ